MVKRNRPPTMAEMLRACDRFNAAVPVGSVVIVSMDSGEQRETVTDSPAQVLSGHTPVVWLKGISGCYLLSRVTPKGAPPDAR